MSTCVIDEQWFFMSSAGLARERSVALDGDVCSVPEQNKFFFMLLGMSTKFWIPFIELREFKVI